VVCRDNRSVRYYCAAQSVIRQATVAQVGWRGVVSSKERSAHFLGEKLTSLDGRGHTAFPNEHLNGIYNQKRRFFDPVTFEIKYPFVQLK
jgi:hypothetical protein